MKTIRTYLVHISAATRILLLSLLVLKLLGFMLVEAIVQTPFATIISVKLACHKNSSTSFTCRALPVKVTGFAIHIHFIVFKDNPLTLFLMFIHLQSGVRLLSFLSIQDFKLGILIVATEKEKKKRSTEIDMNFTNFIIYCICFM